MRRTATTVITAALLVSVLALVGAGQATPAAAGTPPTFTDVPPSHPFHGHITWLAEEGISEGFPDGTYAPTIAISRAAMAAFLHRVAGAPPTTPPAGATFPDVSETHPFFEEVEWLVAEGIAQGYADGTFRPGAPTSRQATAAYLHRSLGSPAFVPGTATFPDVAPTNPFFTEVEWLVAESITTGFADGRFRPVAPGSRQAMAAFVFRQQHLAPTLAVDAQHLTGRSLPWDLAFLPDGSMLFTERNLGLRLLEAGGTVHELATAPAAPLDDLLVTFETGIMGLVLHPDFEANRTFYTCQGEQGEGGSSGHVQLVQWTLDLDEPSVTKEAELVDSAPWQGQQGRHGGCRPRFGPDGHLWLTLGDAACGGYPQDLTALAGKVLRIEVDPVAATATAPADNPFVGDATADDLIYTYGHRNPQGLALRPGTDEMWAVEHGPGIDDEVNRLVPGGNYGWHPRGSGACGYDESVPMTDLVRFPDAVPAAWDTNGPTIATSGGTWLEGADWGGWEGAFVVANLAGRHLRVLFFTDSGVFVEDRVPALGIPANPRLRTPLMGPDDDLYVTTSDGSGDRIVRISASP